MSSRIMLEPAYILHRRPYSNTSLIVDLFTLNHGRLSAIARSARGLKSRYKGKLELFTSMLVSWTGRGELKALGNVELKGAPLLLEGESLLCGFYLNELLMRLLHCDDAHPALFNIYDQTQQQLADRARLQVHLRCFEKKLLHELGYGLPLVREVETGLPIHPDQSYQYIPDRGFRGCSPSDTQAVIFSGKSLVALQQEQFNDEQSLKEVKRLMRMVLARHLGERPLKTRELMR